MFGRLSIAKEFFGDITGTSTGEMMSVRNPKVGSAGYVALERFEGSVGGSKGSFVMQHYGMMAEDENRLYIEIVTGSGEGDLQSIRGSLTIEIVDDVHHYTLQYEVG